MKTIKVKIAGYNPEKKFLILSYNGKKGTIWYSQLYQEFLKEVDNAAIVDRAGIQRASELEVTFEGEFDDSEEYITFNGKIM